MNLINLKIFDYAILTYFFGNSFKKLLNIIKNLEVFRDIFHILHF